MRYKCPVCKSRDIVNLSTGETLCKNKSCLRVSNKPIKRKRNEKHIQKRKKKRVHN